MCEGEYGKISRSSIHPSFHLTKAPDCELALEIDFLDVKEKIASSRGAPMPRAYMASLVLPSIIQRPALGLEDGTMGSDADRAVGG